MWLVISGLIYATIITGIFGALLTLPTIKLREDFLAIVTIVAGEIVRYVANNEQFFNTFSGFSVENPVYDKYSPDAVMHGLFVSGSQFGILLLIIGLTALYYQFAIRPLSGDLHYLIDLKYQRIVSWNIMVSILIMFLEFLGIWGEPSIGLHMLLIFNIVIFIVYRNYGQERISFYGAILLSLISGLTSFIFSITKAEIVIHAFTIDTQVNIQELVWQTAILFLMLIGFGYIAYSEMKDNAIKSLLDNSQNPVKVIIVKREYELYRIIYGIGIIGVVASLIGLVLSVLSDGYMSGLFLTFLTFIFCMFVIYLGLQLVNKFEREGLLGESNSKPAIFSIFIVLGAGISLNSLSWNNGPSIGLQLILITYGILILGYIKYLKDSIDFTILSSVMMSIASFSFFLERFTNSVDIRKITIRDQTIVKTTDWYTCMYALFAMLVVYFIIEELYNSPFGRNLKAIREDEVSATSVGKNVFDYRLRALVIASALTGFAGAVYAQVITIVSPKQYEPTITFTIYIMLIIGGTGNNKGAIFGAFIIQLLFSITRGTLFADAHLFYPELDKMIPDMFTGNFGYINSTRPVNAENLGLIVVGVMLIIFLIYSPDGLIPEIKKGNNRYYELAKYYEGKEEDEEFMMKLLSRFVSDKEKTEPWEI